ncbi:MAG: T9SS type A sorting domain-containing protein [Prolixibacteraceae bacterium]|nr:T9SS type A sorting domain-containing protein [Prolixibacteraceae bacterium]
MGSCALASANEATLAATGNYVYVAAQADGFKIVDVSNPASPVVVKTIASSYPTCVCIQGNVAVALTTTTSPDELEIFNLADPANPARISQMDIEKTTSATISGDYVFISCAEYTGGENGLRIVDISDNANPQEISYLKTNRRTYNVIVDNGLAFLGYQGGFYVVDISDKENPVLLADHANDLTYCEVRCVHCELNTLTVINGFTDTPVEMFDLSDPSLPGLLAGYESPNSVGSLLVVDNTLFASSTQKLFSYSIEDNPAQPLFVGSNNDSGGLSYMKTNNNGLLAGITWDAIQFIDISAQDAPVLLSEFTPASNPLNFALNNSRAFVQTFDGGLEIVNIENPASPQLVNTFGINVPAHDIFLKDSLLFSAYDNDNNTGGVEIIHVDDDEAVLLHNIDVTGTPMTVWIDSDTLLIGSNEPAGRFHIYAYNVADPLNPELLASTSGTGEIRDIEVVNDAILAAVVGQSVMRFTLDVILAILQQLDICHSPGSIQMTTSQTDEEGNGVVYTSDGKSYKNYPSSAKSVNIASSTMSSGTMASGEYGIIAQFFKSVPPPQKFTLSVTVSPGDAVREGCVAVQNGSGRYNEGETATLTASPAEGWKFTGWTGSITSAENPVNVTMDSDNEIAATFARECTLTLSVAPQEAADAGCNATQSGSGSYAFQDVAVITATAAPGWMFQSWTGSFFAAQNPSEVTMYGDYQLTANFHKKFTLNISIDPQEANNEGCTVSQTENVNPEGDIVSTLNALPAEGWKFIQWSGHVTSTQNPIDVLIDENKAVTAVFGREFSLALSISPQEAAEGGCTVSQSGSGIYTEGGSADILATAAEGWRFDSWTGGISSADESATITMDDNKNLTANFVRTYNLTLSISPEAARVAGCTVLQSGNGTYDEGSVAVITYTPAEGWDFVNSRIVLTPFYDNPLSLVMDSDKDVVCFFEQKTGFKLFDDNDDVLVFYPNPVVDKLFIEFPSRNTTVDIKILDILGRVVLKKNDFRESELGLNGLQKGTYLLCFNDGYRFYTVHFLKE